MKIEEFPLEIQPYVIPKPAGKYIYQCIQCKGTYGIEKLLYV